MHEHSLLSGVIYGALTQLNTGANAESGRLVQVKIEVGCLDMHSVESFKQAYYAQAMRTPLDGVELELRVIPGRILCERCGYHGKIGVGEADGHQALPVVECPECGMLCAVEGGRGIHNMELVLQ